MTTLDEAPGPLTPSERTMRRIEWLCLYLIPFGNSLFVSFLYTISGFAHPPDGSQAPASVARFLGYAIVQTATVALLCCVIKRRGQSFASLGFPRKLELRDILMAFPIAVACWIGEQAVLRIAAYGIWSAGAHHLRVNNVHFLVDNAAGTTGIALLALSLARCVNVATNPLCEELVARALTQTEMETLDNRAPLAAAFLSALLQAAYHLYQGPVNALATFAAFSILAVYFARTRRIVPLIGAHLLLDAGAFIWYALKH